MSVLLLVAAGLCKETGFCFFGLLAGWEILRGLLAGPALAQWRRWLRLAALLVLGVAACAARFWYTSGTAIERMDPHSNPIAAEEERSVRVLSYALVHGLYAKLLARPAPLPPTPPPASSNWLGSGAPEVRRSVVLPFQGPPSHPPGLFGPPSPRPPRISSSPPASPAPSGPSSLLTSPSDPPVAHGPSASLHGP